MSDPTQRFSSRVDNYVRYRPGYPHEILEILESDCGLNSGSVLADVASGTGIFTRLLLEKAGKVFGVEPNAGMRQAAEESLAGNPRFVSIDGTAEETTLPPHSVEIVTAAQAAHWFTADKARREFIRILKPGGWTVLIWNERRTASTPFLQAYEQLLLDYGTDYKEVRHERTTAEIEVFFTPSPYRSRVFAWQQAFDYAALEGRLLSSSYTPQADQPAYGPMLRELRKIFDAHQAGGKVAFDYDTRVFYGQLG